MTVSTSAMGTTPQPLKYNGKELETSFDLQTYEYGARQYNSQIGRWNGVDPLADKYYGISPFAYAANNPVKFVDYDGEDYGIYIDHTNRTITYKANYYFKTQTELDMNARAITDWNKLHGTYTTKDNINYEVKFELSL